MLKTAMSGSVGTLLQLILGGEGIRGLVENSVKAMVFPVVMYGCESWTIEKAELQRIDAFELWC